MTGLLAQIRLLAFLVGIVPVCSLSQTQVIIGASKDNTLYENINGTISNGSGQHFFAGTTGQPGLRRGLLAFNVAASIPANATINSVTLRLNMSRTIAGTQSVSLHRALADWGEGSSNASGDEGGGANASTNDATWQHTFFNSAFWTNDGGDFTPTASASQSVGSEGFYTWGSTSGMVNDVQQWLNNPSNNFGWILIGNESTNSTAKRFDTKENATSQSRPQLTVTYTAVVPIQLTSFTATLLANSQVRLEWTTASEVNNYGFYIERRYGSQGVWAEIPDSFIPGHGTTNIPQEYTFTDNPSASGNLHYRLKQVDLDGTTHYTDAIGINVPTTVKEVTPTGFVLKQNFPNPFNPSTEIEFSVERTHPATLEVYDIAGRLVSVLFNDVAKAGQYYTVHFDAGRAASGVYFYKLQSGTRTSVKKLLLLR